MNAQENGVTIIKFLRKLETGDEFDKAFQLSNITQGNSTDGLTLIMQTALLL